jgi:hypothetical protein
MCVCLCVCVCVCVFVFVYVYVCVGGACVCVRVGVSRIKAPLKREWLGGGSDRMTLATAADLAAHRTPNYPRC